MQTDLPKAYDPSTTEGDVSELWLESKAFAAAPDIKRDPYVIMMPLPNVTGALHMGHAMDNVMQDLLVRWHRMQGKAALWMPGTDHAGIATQAVVEKRLLELEGKTRHDIGRTALVERIWQWKDQYQSRIVAQQQRMGCSCDWDRQRFTMDAVCARAVLQTFFKMFVDGLIFRGDRLVNWDCHLQTAIADDEIVYEEVQGAFWHLRYPVIDPHPGEPSHVEVATTRPETMLGDTAVACHPEPARALEEAIVRAKDKLSTASAKERGEAADEVERLEARRTTHLPLLEQLAKMAEDGRQVILPLLDRPIPLILDEWAKPEMGSGCVKITPGHDPNDYDVWSRHAGAIELINILNPDGTLNDNAGPYAGFERFAAREQVVTDLDERGLLASIQRRQVEIGHSDRSKTPVEPYLSKQWFVRMGDTEGGVVCGRGTGKEFSTPGLAQAAIDAARPGWRSASGRTVQFFPDRYQSTYHSWLAEKRDWCISRQLWWGHRLPIWRRTVAGDELIAALEPLIGLADRDDVCIRLGQDDGSSVSVDQASAVAAEAALEILVCLREEQTKQELAPILEQAGLEQDPDVLDTWFSSGIWPHSTLGWPDPTTAPLGEGETTLAGVNNNPDCLSFFYPGSCLVTARDIITLWVARMVVMGLYNLGDVPFDHVFIHANILDGNGVRMSKSKGNGIDPVDIIERYGTDAMRYVLCEMQTGTQDIRLPVQAISPYTGKPVELAEAKHGRSVFTYLCPDTGKEFDVLGTMDDLPSAKLISERFEVGQRFCNKLWNTLRFALPNLEGSSFVPRRLDELEREDRWILSRLARAIDTVTDQLEQYNPSAAIATIREFFWSELCDWYLELIKARMRDDEQAPTARQVLALVLDQVLRLLHPMIPFITETLWAKLSALAPTRGLEEPLAVAELLIHAPWPAVRPQWIDPQLEDDFTFQAEVVRSIRDIRSKYNVPPKQQVTAVIRAGGAVGDRLTPYVRHISSQAKLSSLAIASDAAKAPDAATAVVREVEVYVAGVVDVAKEQTRLNKQRDQLVKGIKGCEQRLANPNFLERAQPEVVERERARLADLKGQLASVEANLREL